MVRLSTEQERVSNLISDTVTLLCRNGLHFKSEMKVQGLLGISLDNEVFLVQIEKSFGELPNVKPVTTATAASQGESSANESDTNSTGNETIRKRHHRKRRKCPSPPVVSSPRIKQEPGMEDDLVVIATDTKPDLHDKDSMQESYKEIGQVDYGRPFVRQSQSTMYTQDTSQSVNSSLHSDQLNHDNPGCSAWDDPLASLVTVPDDNTSKADDIDVDVIGDADDSLDPQAMSTTLLRQDVLTTDTPSLSPVNDPDIEMQLAAQILEELRSFTVPAISTTEQSLTKSSIDAKNTKDNDVTVSDPGIVSNGVPGPERDEATSDEAGHGRRKKKKDDGCRRLETRCMPARHQKRSWCHICWRRVAMGTKSKKNSSGVWRNAGFQQPHFYQARPPYPSSATSRDMIRGVAMGAVGAAFNTRSDLNTLAPYMSSFDQLKPRRSSTSGSKQFICGYPGCNKSYFSRTNMLHHQAYKHGRQRGQPGPCIVKGVPLTIETTPEGHSETSSYQPEGQPGPAYEPDVEVLLSQQTDKNYFDNVVTYSRTEDDFEAHLSMKNT